MTYITQKLSQFITLALIMVSTLLLTACETPKPPTLVSTPIGASIPIQVANIDFFNDHDPQAVETYTDHLYYPTLADMLMTWGTNTLIPSDANGNLLMTIAKADLRELDIASNDDLKALFTNEQRKLVIADLEAVFSFTHPDENRTASIVVKSSYQNTIADYTTPAESERIRYFVMTEAIARFDEEFRRQITDVSAPQNWPVAP